jgi:hypothetical protein
MHRIEEAVIAAERGLTAAPGPITADRMGP